MTRFVLALDTAGESVHLALAEFRIDGTGLTQARTTARAAHRATNAVLLTEIEQLLASADITREHLAAIAVGCTLGSYTGVRIAVATAKGLAYALGIPLFGVATCADTDADALSGTQLLDAFTGEYDAQTGDVSAVLPRYTRLSYAEEAELATRSATSQTITPTECHSGGAQRNPESMSHPDGTHGRPQDGMRATIRRLTPFDLAALSALETATDGLSWSRESLADELSNPDRYWFGAFESVAGRYRPVGFIGCADTVDGFDLLQIAVADTHRRRGIARDLLTFAGEHLLRLHDGPFTLEVRADNESAIALYTGCGFATIATRAAYYPDGTDAVIMVRRLTSAALAHPALLAIESSCDETAAAVIAGEALLSSVVASQIQFHARFGGVVPEIASRKHTEAIVATVDEALHPASTGMLPLRVLDGIAVTDRPGLIGALVVGLAFAKGLAWAADLPLYGVNHLEGHLYASTLNTAQNEADEGGSSSASPFLASGLPTPHVALIVSGGHTALVYSPHPHEYTVLGSTLDDAAGEAFDKVAKVLGLGYPGGPALSKLAVDGNPAAIDFPRALLHSHDYDFSLSGLKTAVITWIRAAQDAGADINLPDLAASFQLAIIDVQVAKSLAAVRAYDVDFFILGGGVAANVALRTALAAALNERGVELLVPDAAWCGDNAAMIARTAAARLSAGMGERDRLPLSAEARARAMLD
ncbi:MAG: tRNA (adenosine(37)-N6)-threonylcarbamoyltransferase complex transferase subunit TsaD [Actinomycetes bacterium]|jgi:N6-L-threonylcarbamoyladenine synthase|nr:tRNA (adenosine(37)-N6)-threonylcarbamoyltransferase complex transferase subunit TsaD [Actinomycetes bacterium]